MMARILCLYKKQIPFTSNSSTCKLNCYDMGWRGCLDGANVSHDPSCTAFIVLHAGTERFYQPAEWTLLRGITLVKPSLLISTWNIGEEKETLT